MNFKRERRPLGVDWLNTDRSLKLISDHFRYCEAETHPTLVVRSTFGTKFSEKLKEALHILLFDADASVNHRSEKSTGDIIIGNVYFDPISKCEF